MNCEMCGRQTEISYKTKVESSFLNLCKQCSSFGKVVSSSRAVVNKIMNKSSANQDLPAEKVDYIVDNFNSLIKNGRERLGLTQKQFAEKLFEKESLIAKLETGHIKPTIKLAKKIEKLINVRLVLQTEGITSFTNKNRKSQSTLTIGDLLKEKLKSKTKK